MGNGLPNPKNWAPNCARAQNEQILFGARGGLPHASWHILYVLGPGQIFNFFEKGFAL